ncbi:hypothetical protein D3C72_2163180 [compost metagenome]
MLSKLPMIWMVSAPLLPPSGVPLPLLAVTSKLPMAISSMLSSSATTVSTPCTVRVMTISVEARKAVLRLAASPAFWPLVTA